MSSQQQQQPSGGHPQGGGGTTYGQNRPRGGGGSRGGGQGYRGQGNRGTRGNYRGRGRGDSQTSYFYDRDRQQAQQQQRGVNLPTAATGDGGRGGHISANRFQSMMGGGGQDRPRNQNNNQRQSRTSYGGPSETTQGKNDGGNKSMASQKFDALFGGAAAEESEATPNDQSSRDPAIDQVLSDSLAPSRETGQRKYSNVDGGRVPRGDYRKQSNVSAGSGNAQLNALFPQQQTGGAKVSAVAASTSGRPRVRLNKDQMLAQFKQTKELDMSVFEADRILDYAELFISSGAKPTFVSSKKVEEPSAEKDPFDDMVDESLEESKESEQKQGGMLPESVRRTQKKPDVPLQQKAGPYHQNNKGGSSNYHGNKNQSYHNNNNQGNYNKHQQHYRSGAEANFHAYDEDEDEDPEWNDFDPEKQTGNFFGREIPEEVKLRQELEEKRDRWGGARRQAADDEDEFDAMFEEEKVEAEEQKQIGVNQEEPLEVTETQSEKIDDVGAEFGAVKTLDEISEEVPQDIKDKIIDLEAEQQERLRQTMLRNTFQPKTSALKNLQEMFSEYPVVTNESLKLKMSTLGQVETESEEAGDNGLTPKQQVFSQLLTSINPFAQFILQEMVIGDTTTQHWVLDEKILQRHPDEQIKRENLLKTSAEMFSVYLYTKDPTMRMKSDKYTQGEFKAVKDLVQIENSLLISSQMANSLLLLQQHEKLLKDAQQEISKKSEAPAASAADSTERRPSGDASKPEASPSEAEQEASSKANVAAPAAEVDDENDVLADLNAQLKNMLM